MKLNLSQLISVLQLLLLILLLVKCITCDNLPRKGRWLSSVTNGHFDGSDVVAGTAINISVSETQTVNNDIVTRTSATHARNIKLVSLVHVVENLAFLPPFFYDAVGAKRYEMYAVINVRYCDRKAWRRLVRHTSQRSP